jgi:hypothetical protein
VVREQGVKIRVLILSCKDASILLSEAQDRALGPYERFKLRVHLSLCDGCTNFLRQLHFMRAALRRFRDSN